MVTLRQAQDEIKPFVVRSCAAASRTTWLILLIFTTLNAHPEFKLGLENIPDTFITTLSPSKPLAVGLITNQTGKDQKGRNTADVLIEKKIIVKYLFAPEHGIKGTEKAGTTVVDSHDHKQNIPIISLYKHGSGAAIRDQCMAEIDALVFDIQDSGMRHYTYISTLFYAIECAALYNKKIIVLDRPNPLGGIIEGPLVEPPLKSFLSIAEIPLRHGMTVGELAYFFNAYAVKKKADLSIIPMKHYERAHGIGKTLCTALSPNIKCIDSCYGYSFLGLLGEVKPFHLGVGTADAFQIITLPVSLKLPESFWSSLATRLSAHGISSTPTQSVHPSKKTQCKGLRIHIPNINNASSFHALLTILEQCKQAQIPLEFSESFDKAAGTAKVREYIQGTLNKEMLAQFVNIHMKTFLERAKTAFHYEPAPQMREL